jgi:formylglycine-generating enzyme required for sulfatase activity
MKILGSGPAFTLGAVSLGVCLSAPAAAPRIHSISIAPPWTLEVQSRVGITNQIQSADRPGAANWTVLTNLLVTRSPYWVVDARMAAPQARFYRVLARLDMVTIPAGSFVMGDNFGDGSDEFPLRTNALSAFCLDQYEVTLALWNSVRTWAVTNGYGFDQPGSGKAAQHPVHNVTWHDAVKWCNARSEKEGLTPAYYTSAGQGTVYRTGRLDLQNDWVKWKAGYRLPTEAEWEKAARGGARAHRFPWADADSITHSRANYDSESNWAYDLSPTRGCHPDFQTEGVPYTSPVGHFAPNGYGLHDMAGNVCEWCWDRYGLYGALPETDPRGPATGSYRLIRGGGWSSEAASCRAASRSSGSPAISTAYLGFRCVLPVAQP